VADPAITLPDGGYAKDNIAIEMPWTISGLPAGHGIVQARQSAVRRRRKHAKSAHFARFSLHDSWDDS